MPAIIKSFLVSRSTDPIVFHPIISDECSIEIEFQFDDPTDQNIRVVLQMEVLPSSHFMFSNNRKILTQTFHDINHGDQIIRKFCFKRKMHKTGTPALLVNISTKNITYDIPGRLKQIPSWPYIIN